MLGALEEQFEKALEDIKDHGDRIIKLENKSKASDATHKRARNDIDDLMDKVNKMENGNKMKDALMGGALGDDSVEMILKAINDMQDKISEDMEEKLKNYTPLPLFQESETEMKGISRRVGYNEGVLKELKTTTDEYGSKIEGNRKKIQRLQSEIDALKSGAPMQELATPVLTSTDEVGAGDLDKLQKMIQRVEGNLIRRIASVETGLGRINSLEDKVQDMELLIRRLQEPKEPIITVEDVERWNDNIEKSKELEEMIRKLQMAFKEMNVDQIKADILNIFKIQNNFILKKELNPVNEAIKRFATDIENNQFEIASFRDRITKNEKSIETNFELVRNEQISL